jgi:hypothetical protein
MIALHHWNHKDVIWYLVIRECSLRKTLIKNGLILHKHISLTLINMVASI